MPNLAFLYHINFNHLSLAFLQRSNYIEKYLDQILDSLIVNSTISICTEDLLLLKRWNPKCFKKLINHSRIKFLLPFHNHTIPQIYPDQFLFQAKLGKKIISDLVPVNKLLKIGYSSEVDLFPKEIFPQITSIWEGIVLGETRINISGYSQNQYPPIFKITNGRNQITAYLSRRKFEYRNYLHEYLRGEIDKEPLLKAVKSNFTQFSPNSTLLARIDLEVIIFNSFIKNRKVLPPPIRKWFTLQRYLRDNGIHFYNFDNMLDNNLTVPTINLKDIKTDCEDNHKWGNKRLKSFVVKYIKSTTEPKLKPVALSLLCSDYYCTAFKDWIFIHPKDKSKKIVICKNRFYRDQEARLKINMLKQKLNVNHVDLKLLDKDLAKYLMYFSQSTRDTISYL